MLRLRCSLTGPMGPSCHRLSFVSTPAGASQELGSAAVGCEGAGVSRVAPFDTTNHEGWIHRKQQYPTMKFMSVTKPIQKLSGIGGLGAVFFCELVGFTVVECLGSPLSP